LYVALTRAKEKLIITGSTKNLDKQIRKWMGERYCSLEKLPFTTLLGTGSYMDLIGFALIRHHSFAPIYRQMNIPVKFTNTLYDQDADIKVKYIKINDIIYEKVKDAVQKENLKENLLHWDTAYIYNEEVKNELEYRLQFKYPYESNKNIHTKMTVSEIKKLSQIIDEEGSVLVLKEEGLPDEGMPAFISGKEEISGTARGSAYHRVLEFIDFSMKPGLKNVEEFINKLVAGGKLREEAASSIKPSSIVHLLQSGLGARLASACRQNRLHREQQYVMGISAADINEQCNKEEIVLVQGIIDAYFEEDSLVIVDYKTDRVENADILKNRYKVQLDYYEKALEQITGKKVKEKIIYSLYLETEVVVP
jgi:ATP-dependent helicase/nuclease subunit A